MVLTKKMNRLLFWAGLSLPMLALLAMTWLVHASGGQFNDSFIWMQRNYKVLDMFEQTQVHVVEAEANERGFLLTGRKEYLVPYRAAMTSVYDDLSELKNLTRGDAEQEANIALLAQTVTNELVFDPAKAHSIATNASVVALTARGKQKIEAVRRILFRARQEQEQALSQHQQAAEKDVVSSQVMSLVLIVAVAMALILVVFILLRLEKLQEFVTVCAWTGQVKYEGRWLRLDQYLKQQFGISVSHSLSEEASERMKREIETLNRDREPPRPPG